MPVRPMTVDGLDLVVAEEGAGGRPILLLHGFAGAKEDFTVGLESDGAPGALDLLGAAGWHAAAPDQRGHGQSAKPADEGAYSTERYAADALQVAEGLGWERFTLLGHSMGGMIAQVLALTWPERVDRLILMDTGPGPLRGVDRSQAEVAVAIIREQGMDHLADIMAERRGEGPLDTPASKRLIAERPGWHDFADRKLRASSGAMYAAMLREIFEQENRLAALASIEVPTLVIVGEQDEPFVEPSRRMTEVIPDARLEIVPDAGHSPPFENPDGWWKALGGFLGEVAP